MPPVAAIILHPEPSPDAGPLETLLGNARAALGRRHAAGLAAAGAEEVRIASGERDGITFGARMGGLVAALRVRHADGRAGIVVLGSGSIPLARPGDLNELVEAAAGTKRAALANNRYSADAIAIARADLLPPIPPLPSDNALPRWLDEVAGWKVDDRRDEWRLGIDLDSPLDLALLAAADEDEPRDGELPLSAGAEPWMLGPSIERIRAIGSLLGNRRAEVIVTGRTSARTIEWLERRTASRIRALVEERGLRASSGLALGRGDAPDLADGGASPDLRARPPRSVVGMLLDDRGAGALGSVLAELGDGALVDTRVLLAHRLGRDEIAWPSAEDRFCSDLGLVDRISDPWLRDLTASAVAAPIPVVLGAHTLVGPGVRLVARAGARDR